LLLEGRVRRDKQQDPNRTVHQFASRRLYQVRLKAYAEESCDSRVRKHMNFSGISVLRAPDTEGRPAVAVILSNDMKMTSTEGETYPGAALQPKQARLVAYRMLAIAAEIEAESI
jgi:hypothetical protein